MAVARDDPPPHELKLVVEFVNTLDLDEGTDELATPAGLARWLGVRGLLGERVRVGALERQQALGLREALRIILRAHSDAPADDDDGAAAALETVAERGQLSVRFAADGTVTLAPRAGGVAGALASLLGPVARAAADGTWARVKLCAAEDCGWAFYDRSRNRSGRWCDMAVCGNRTKVRTYRTKRGP
ncbi:MAG: CGNR zinc finger domain-containing protein [Solirubrobacteraceae bacterium]